MKENIKAYSLFEISVVILILSLLMVGAFNAFNAVSVNTKKVLLKKDTTNSPAATIPGMTAWYEAPQTTASNYHPWKDINPQSINKKDLSGRMYYAAKGINNFPSVYFTFNWAWINSQFIGQSDVVSSEGNTLFLVSRCGKSVCGSPFAISYAAGCRDEGNFGNAKYELIVDHMWDWFCYTIIGESRNGQSVCGSYSWTKWYAKDRIMTFQNNPSKFFIRIDGGIFAENYSINPSFMEIGSTPVKINVGCGPGGSPTYRDFRDGWISEIILYNRPLSENEIKSVESYLSKKYMIPLASDEGCTINGVPGVPEGMRVKSGSGFIDCGNGYSGKLFYECSCNKVFAYNESNYTGGSYGYLPGNYGCWLPNGNDAISSIKVPEGMSVTICHDCNFRNCGFVSSATQSLVGTGYDNSASCLLVSKTGTCKNGIFNVISSCTP